MLNEDLRTEEFVNRLKSDDPRAWERLTNDKSTKSLVLRAISRAQWDSSYTHEDFEDIRAELLSRTYTHISDLRDPGKFEPWFYKTCINVAKDSFRKKRQKENKERPMEEDDDWSGAGQEPEKDMMRRLLAGELLSKLPEKYRKLLNMWMDGYTAKEIAEKLSMQEKTVSSYISRAIEMIREHLPGLCDKEQDGKQQVTVSGEAN